MPDMLAIDLFALQLRAIRYQPILGAILATRPPSTHLFYGGPPFRGGRLSAAIMPRRLSLHVEFLHREHVRDEPAASVPR